jgi:glyoxylase-like metal-dependent hydrolase (beta-lactamase superfamily II)/rhodanese-related sulfurtransferase
MKIEQIYTGCLAQGAYYITSNGEAAVIDPLREVQPYIERAKRDGVTIKYIFETHFHADFVSGHLDLSRKTSAPIIYGPTANPEFPATIAKDGQEFRLGNIVIKALHTPGHTMESTCYLLSDETGKQKALFSGDTLFLGDVGRPDLAQKAASLTKEDLAGFLYESLTNKILPLDEDIIVYPAHGAGSACGKNMMKETTDTLGNQKKINYALNQPDKSSFIKAVTDGLMPPPAYFPANVSLNKKGYESIDKVLSSGMRKLSVDEFAVVAEDTGAVVLDTRDAKAFSEGFVPKSINIGLKGDFAPWVGALIKDTQQPILLVTDKGSEKEAVVRLSRIGFDNVLGYLNGGFEAWKLAGKETDEVNRITAKQFANEFDKSSVVIDVRREPEYSAEHVEEAFNKPLDQINEWFSDIGTETTFYVHCAGGYRSVIASSILKARGIHNFKEIEGGFKAISDTGLPRTDFVCPSKLNKIK